MAAKVRIIALYLPQFHPTYDNNRWWGNGFTEWTNVGKAKPLFKGHYQPKVPADLGYYDLRLPEVREAQANLAKEAGIEGFCYYHYWFGAGKQELEYPFKEVIRLGKPDFPFCLCWANESWHAKFWNNSGNSSKKLLIEQRYLGDEDNKMHFYSLLPAFQDKRYVRIDNKPLFVIYKPLDIPEVEKFMAQWNNLAQENGLAGIYFITQTDDKLSLNSIMDKGFDTIIYNPLFSWNQEYSRIYKIYNKIRSRLLYRVARVENYAEAINRFNSDIIHNENIVPVLIPNWDHTPRSGRGGYILKGSTPELFECHARQILNVVKNKSNKIIFLKSWNEWGEGNYMEPDLMYGKGYIEALRKAIDDLKI